MDVIDNENQPYNYKVTILGRKWDSIAQCCKYYKISYNSVCAYKWKEKCDNDKAISHFLEAKKRRDFIIRKRSGTISKNAVNILI